jgi:ATP-binding cassette subfamily B protein
MKKYEKSTINKLIKLYIKFNRKHKALFVGMIITSILGVCTDRFLGPIAVSKILTAFQVAASNGVKLDIEMIKLPLVMFLAAEISALIIWRASGYIVWQMEFRVMYDIRRYLFNHLQNMDHKFFQDRFMGSLTSQFGKFLGQYESAMDILAWDLITAITGITGTIIIISFISLPLAGIISILAIAYSVLTFYIRKSQQPFEITASELNNKTVGVLADSLTNHTSIKEFTKLSYENKYYKTIAKKERDYYVGPFGNKVLRADIANHFSSSMLNLIAISGAILLALKSNISAGDVYLILSLSFYLSDKLWRLSSTFRRISRIIGESEPMVKILELEPEIKDPTHPEKSKISAGGISFNKLKFSYGDSSSGTKKLFSNFNLDIKPGEKIGLVGPSGGGKTTITKLILRFMDVNGGEILIDGQNIASITQNDLRKNITYVPQEPLLFHRSLKENIAYGKPGATEAEIIEVAKKARAHEFITPLKSGYNTLVGERGTKLSGGQRQRVAIARAMLKPAPILILDEATSALDSESEKKIQEALWELMKNKTAIVVAHRLSTIKHMDRIIVIENGKIKEQGSHTELIKLKGSYANLWQHQSGGFV